MLFLFIIFNGYSSERLAIIVQVISWIIEVNFQGGRCTVNFVMFVFNVFDYSINSPTFVTITVNSVSLVSALLKDMLLVI